MTPKHFDVAIVGMGPVGAAAALFLAHEGLNVVVFEKGNEVYQLPRAVALDGEIVRAFQKIGLGDELNTILQQVRPGERAGFTNSKREWLFGQELVPFGRNGWQPISMFDQPQLEQFIRGALSNCYNCAIYLGEAVREFNDLGNKVEITSSARTISADWLIACDGAASHTRKQLNIGWQDLGYDHEWLVVDVTLNPGAELQPETLQVCDPERLVTYVGTIDPFRRWEFKLKDGETAEDLLQDTVIEQLIEPWLSPDQYTLRRKAVYQFHAATADQWRVGRVFLAGDAAHQTPPFLGQGLNAGMRDIVNLSWKLGLVQRGVCQESLLDTYEAERSPHAQDLVEWAVSLGQLMEHLAATEAAQTLGQPAPELPPQKQASGYGQGREAPPLRRGAITLDQVSNEGSTGYLFCQPIIETPTGSDKLDSKLGSGFALVSRTGFPPLSEQSQNILAALNIELVCLSNVKTKQGHFDPLFEQADAAVIRPDRYVFGHTSDQLTVDDLLENLATSLALNSISEAI